MRSMCILYEYEPRLKLDFVFSNHVSNFSFKKPKNVSMLSFQSVRSGTDFRLGRNRFQFSSVRFGTDCGLIRNRFWFRSESNLAWIRNRFWSSSGTIPVKFGSFRFSLVRSGADYNRLRNRF